MKNDKFSLRNNLIPAIRHAWMASPFIVLFLIACSLLLCAAQVMEIYALRAFFDAAGSAANASQILRAGIPMAALLLAGPLIQIAEFIAQGYFWRRSSGYLLSLFHLRAGTFSLSDFETTQVYDRMDRAKNASESAPVVARSCIQILFNYLPYLAFTSVFLFRIKPLLVLALMFLFASVLLSQYIRASRATGFEQRNSGLRRQAEYFQSCITSRESFKETRTLGAFSYFYQRYLGAASRFVRASLKQERGVARMELALRAINIAGYAGILGLLVYDLCNGSITVGAFASVFYSVEKMTGILSRMVDEVGEALQCVGISSFFFRFFEQAPEEGLDRPLDKKSALILHNVSFAYPGCSPVLQNIDLQIGYGETLAIVGENGAGKTTLTKVLAGLYRPATGTVQYGSQDLNAYAPRRRFQSISAVFQNFMRYKMTLGENIRISHMDSHSPPEQAMELAGMPTALPAPDLDAMLSREFGGTDLSGGQWQRVAIARGLYRAHDLIILDEPTAAIDPLEETSIFQLFQRSAKGKTAILVTHRLGSAKIADKIIVLDGGRIVERGNHAELMARGGKYCSMFREQAAWYDRG